MHVCIRYLMCTYQYIEAEIGNMCMSSRCWIFGYDPESKLNCLWVISFNNGAICYGFMVTLWKLIHEKVSKNHWLQNADRIWRQYMLPFVFIDSKFQKIRHWFYCRWLTVCLSIWREMEDVLMAFSKYDFLLSPKS